MRPELGQCAWDSPPAAKLHRTLKKFLNAPSNPDLLESLAMATTMVEGILVPAGTVVSAKGDGAPIDVSGAASRVFLVSLAITKIIEQESIDVSVYGSADGATWGAKSIAAFPQKFYCEEAPLLLDLTAHPDVKIVRAHWEVARWGRGTETPMFEFGVTLKEVPADILQEAISHAKA